MPPPEPWRSLADLRRYRAWTARLRSSVACEGWSLPSLLAVELLPKLAFFTLWDRPRSDHCKGFWACMARSTRLPRSCGCAPCTRTRRSQWPPAFVPCLTVPAIVPAVLPPENPGSAIYLLARWKCECLFTPARGFPRVGTESEPSSLLPAPTAGSRCTFSRTPQMRCIRLPVAGISLFEGQSVCRCWQSSPNRLMRAALGGLECPVSHATVVLIVSLATVSWLLVGVPIVSPASSLCQTVR